MNCFNAGHNGAAGEDRYPKYMMTHLEETYCKTCGTSKSKIKDDLYEVYIDEWRNVVRKSDNKIIEESVWYKAYKPYLEAQEAAKKAAASQAKAAPKAATASVATFSLMADEAPVEDVVVADENIVVNSDEITVDEIEAVVPALTK